MRRKSSNTNGNKDDIELPLLSKPKKSGQGSYLSPKPDLIKPSASSSSGAKFIQSIPLFKFITFLDIWPLVKLVNTKTTPLEAKELPLPFKFCNIEQKIKDLDNAWFEQQGPGKTPSIVKAVLKAFKKECLVGTLVCFFLITSKLISTLLIGSIIDKVTQSNFGLTVNQNEIWMATGLFVILTVILCFLNAWYWHLAFIIAASMRNTIVGFLYRKLQGVALSSVQEINIGKVINLLSNDVNEIDKGFIQMIPSLLSPYTILVSGILMYNFFGFIAIFGLLGLVGAVILSSYLSKKSESMKKERSAITDERIKRTNELIECIRLLKMYAWEKTFKSAIINLRQNEMVKILKLRILHITGECFANTSPQISLVAMCIMYVVGGGSVTPENIYTSLMILGFAAAWGITPFHYGMMFVASVRVMKTRLESVLEIKDVLGLEDTIKKLSIAKDNKGSPVIFKNYSAWWKKDQQKACLNKINLTLYPGQVTTAIGSIGSGKTTFLLCFLKEIPVTEGTLICDGKVAYVEQEPIIFSGTIRSNIIFGLEYNEALYEKVVRACNLYIDFKQFAEEDMTIVGERGITLSGGQKARISLARALYSESDIYLFDDPLSAVDSKVGRHIFNYAIRGDLLKDKVVVLVTHHLNYAKESDRVLLFSEGEIIGDGSFEQLRTMENSLFDKFKEIEDEEKRRTSSLKQSSATEAPKEVEKKEEKKEKAPIGENVTKSVTKETYIRYAKENGSYIALFFVFAFYILSVTLNVGFSRYIGYWGQASSEFEFEKSQRQTFAVDDEVFDNTPYIIKTVVLLVCIILVEITKSILTNRFLLKANSIMLKKALKKITKAHTRFFDQTPIGTILNRFSNDLGILDNNGFLIQIVFDGLIHLIIRMVTLILITPSMTIPIILVFLLLLKTRLVFQKSVMETKRIDLASKSPIYSQISATINGLLAIRVYRQGGTFIKRFHELIYNSSRAFLYMERIIRFFSFAMGVVLDSLIVIGTFLSIFVAFYTNLEAGLFGLVLLILQDVAVLGAKVIRVSLLVDINMQSVNRITEYYDLESEAPKHVPNKDNALKNSNGKNWPINGQITFNNVYMKYRSDLDYVLQGLTFDIPGGQKIGVVGRTGAGKSSILQTLFRMTEIEYIPGSSISIDGVNISHIGLEMLRTSLAIIPQNPVVFSGKVRRNLDPFNRYSDDELWQSLSEVNLRDHIESLPNGLDTDMTMSNSVFSAGQKQLICLARAILKKSKIIVLDEATANVDIETDDFIQKKIMEKFKDCTVITIAHRLITIANYDKVLVMDKGKAVEFDAPYKLMVETEGDDYITRNNGLFAQMVKNSGESMSKKIFDISYNKFKPS